MGRAGWLQARYNLPNVGRKTIDLIKEKQVRQSQLFEPFQNHLQSGHAFGIGLAHDDGCIARRQRQGALVLEFNRARAINECELVIEERHVGDIERNAHAVIARFGRGIANGVFRCNRAGSRNCAGAGEDRFEKRRLSAREGPDQRDAARAASPGLSAVGSCLF